MLKTCIHISFNKDVFPNPVYLYVTTMLKGNDGDTVFLERQRKEFDQHLRHWRLRKQEPPTTP